MRKFILALLGLVAVSIVSLTAFSCRGARQHIKKELARDVNDSVFVMDMVQEYTNPLFSTTTEALSFREDVKEGARVDSIFNTIPTSTLKYVCNVCQNKYGKFRKRCIVQEYMDNREIYDNLPQQSQPTQLPPDITQQPQKEEPVVLNPTEGEPTRVGNTVSIQIKHQDTIINGKPHTVETTTKTIEK